MVVTLFITIGILVLIASIISLILDRVNIPPIVSYLITGIIAGFLSIKPKSDIIDSMIELGIILLLFLAGLEIKLKGIFELGKATLIIGEGHDLIMGVVGFLIAKQLFGLDTIASLYIAIGVTLSSTIVVIRALISRREVAAPHGKILIGTMILQDIVAMIALAFFSSIGTETTLLSSILITFTKGILILSILILLGRYILPRIFYYAARSMELIFIVALGWCFAGITLAHYLGFSTAIGAFLAGLAIAELPFSFEINDKAKGLRDFGILLFFLSVGLNLEITPALFLDWKFYFLNAFVILFTPVITALIASYLKFTKKEIFVMSMVPTQISEFTLILITFGLTAGHITNYWYTMMTLVIISTIVISSWLIENLNLLYKNIKSELNFLEWRHIHKPSLTKKNIKNHIVVFGYGPLGQKITQFYKKKKKDIIVIEWRPELIKIAKQHNCQLIYGDASDADIWEEINLNKADLVLSTIGENIEDDINLVRWIKQHNKNTKIILEENDPKLAKRLYKAGVNIVLIHDNLEWNILEKYLSSKNTSKQIFLP